MENKILSDMLGDEYDNENPLVNYLRYLLAGTDQRPTPYKMFNCELEAMSSIQRGQYFSKYNTWRKKYDFDVIVKHGNLNADMIYSPWTPIKMCLQCSTAYPYSSFGNEEKPYKSKPYIPNIIKNIDKYLPSNQWDFLYDFVELAMIEANVWILPPNGRCMQSRTDGTISFYEQIPRTLYECFSGGCFDSCFEGDDEFRCWIYEQNLTMLFNKNGMDSQKITRDAITPILDGVTPKTVQWFSKKEDLEKVIQRYSEHIRERSENSRK